MIRQPSSQNMDKQAEMAYAAKPQKRMRGKQVSAACAFTPCRGKSSHVTTASNTTRTTLSSTPLTVRTANSLVRVIGNDSVNSEERSLPLPEGPGPDSCRRAGGYRKSRAPPD